MTKEFHCQIDVEVIKKLRVLSIMEDRPIAEIVNEVLLAGLNTKKHAH